MFTLVSNVKRCRALIFFFGVKTDPATIRKVSLGHEIRPRPRRGRASTHLVFLPCAYTELIVAVVAGVNFSLHIHNELPIIRHRPWYEVFRSMITVPNELMCPVKVPEGAVIAALLATKSLKVIPQKPERFHLLRLRLRTHWRV